MVRAGYGYPPQMATTGAATAGSRSSLALAALLAAAGTMHFVRPQPFDDIVPRALPGRARTWTYASGLVELTCAALVAVPRTRRVGAALTAATFVGVFPANIQAAVDHRPPHPLGVAMWARLPLQVPLVIWALRNARR
jgi:uncharacterized membrane protein